MKDPPWPFFVFSLLVIEGGTLSVCVISPVITMWPVLSQCLYLDPGGRKGMIAGGKIG